MESAGPEVGTSLKSVPSAVLKDVVLEVLKFLHHEKLFIDLKLLREKAETTTEKGWSEEHLQAVVNEVMHIFRVTDRLNLEKDSIGVYLKKTYQFPPGVISIIANACKEKAQLLSSEAETIDMGKVVDLKWKVGVSLSSKNCKTLNYPFVTVSLTLALPGGTKCDKTFEMSISEFQNFHGQLLEMAAVLATV